MSYTPCDCHQSFLQSLSDFAEHPLLHERPSLKRTLQDMNETDSNIVAPKDGRASHAVANACPVCGDTGQGDLFVYNGFQLKRCGNCELVYTETRHFPDHLYDDVYSSQIAYREMMNAADRTAQGVWGRKQLSWFKKKALSWLRREAPGRRLLELGCGPGTFLLVARQEGWDVTGVEPTLEAANKAATFGLDVFKGYLEDYVESSSSQFDAVVSFEVLEHVPNPLDQLRWIHALVKPGGIVVLSVPNLDDPYCLKQRNPASIPPVHINFFNRRSLGRAIQDAGFVVVRFYTLPIPSSTVRNLHRKKGFILRLPWLAVARLMGKADGTTLLALARRPS